MKSTKNLLLSNIYNDYVICIGHPNESNCLQLWSRCSVCFGVGLTQYSLILIQNAKENRLIRVWNMVQHVLPFLFLINLLILVSLTIVSIIFPYIGCPIFFWLISFLLSVVVILVKLHARVPVLVTVDWTWLLVLWCIHDHISCAYREMSAQKIPRTTQKILRLVTMMIPFIIFLLS